VKYVPGSTYFVDSGTFQSENLVLTLSVMLHQWITLM